MQKFRLQMSELLHRAGTRVIEKAQRVGEAMAVKLNLTMSVEEFQGLSEAEQARTRAEAFIANKQWGDVYRIGRRVNAQDVGPALTPYKKQVAGEALVYLDSAGDLFLDRSGGLAELCRLVAEATGWGMAGVVGAIGDYLEGYVINVASWTISRASEE